MKKALIVLLGAVNLSGCIVPGMKMQVVHGDGEVLYAQSELAPPDAPGVKIQRITADVIAEQTGLLRQDRSNRKGTATSYALEPYEYRIGPRDILSITVWEHPELTIPAGEFRQARLAGHVVSENGNIFYPHAGVVKVSDKTVAEVRDLLTKKIAGKIVDPQLDVRVVGYRSQRAYVLGQVADPGPRPITDIPLTLVDAINGAGGLTKAADMRNVSLTRDGRTTTVNLMALYEEGDISQNALLLDGDFVHVPDSADQKVFVLGEVQQPRSRHMTNGRMTLAEAIGDAGGVDPLTSDAGRIWVVRGEPEQPSIFHLNADSPDALILADQFHLRPRDVVYVDPTGLTRWSRIVSQFLPTAITVHKASQIDFPLFKGQGRSD